MPIEHIVMQLPDHWLTTVSHHPAERAIVVHEFTILRYNGRQASTFAGDHIGGALAIQVGVRCVQPLVLSCAADAGFRPRCRCCDRGHASSAFDQERGGQFVIKNDLVRAEPAELIRLSIGGNPGGQCPKTFQVSP